MYLQTVISRKNFKQKLFFVDILKSLTKKAGTGSISQRHGSADPDPIQNVMDPEHFYEGTMQKGITKSEKS